MKTCQTVGPADCSAGFLHDVVVSGILQNTSIKFFWGLQILLGYRQSLLGYLQIFAQYLQLAFVNQQTGIYLQILLRYLQIPR